MPRLLSAPDARRVVNTVMHPLAPRELSVHRVDVVGPAMIRVTLTGEQAGTVPFLPWAAGDHVKLVLPTEDGALTVPGLGDSGRPDFSALVGDVRDYTIRGVDSEEGTLVIDGLMHEHGPAGRWFRRAAPGDRVGVLGPRGSHLFPPGYAHYVLVGDETALPALGRWLEEPGLRARVTLMTVAEQPEPYLFPEPEQAQLEPHHLVLPLDGPDGARGEALAEHLRLALSSSPTPEDVFVFAAGEAGMLRPLRAVLRELGHPRHAMKVDGYWRRGVAEFDHHGADDED